LSHDETQTERAGELLGQALAPRGVVFLLGDMGSGKTVLVRGLARALGVDPREVQSPTYTLVHEHEGEGGRLVHVDLYRLEAGEVGTLGLDELLAGEGVVAIEWAERLSGHFPPTISAEIRRRVAGQREILLRGAVEALPERLPLHI
jgi:tRNA threonylcarbamoyladenosine biosynthesis protein TsaE